MIDASEQEKLRARFNPDGSLLRRHQLRMLEMLKYIDDVCKRHDIKYWLCSGTLLGAVRHGGFIPWDDDVDIEMLREDYEKFVKVMDQEPKTDYVLQTHKTDFNYFAPYGKVRDLHSEIKECNTNDLYYKYHGVYIDVFIMEPSSSVFLCRVSNKIQHLMLYRPNRYLHHPVLRKFYFSISFFLLHKLLFPFMRCLSAWHAHGQLRHTLGSDFPKIRRTEDIFPLSGLQFEGYVFPVPGNYDSYLTKIYGNYMSLPDVDKVIMHTVNVDLK